MNELNVFLPTLNIEDLNRLVDTNAKNPDSAIANIIKNTYDFMYDDAYEYAKLLDKDNSNLKEVMKMLSIKGQAINDDGSKTKASATTLSTLLTQTTFGKTGMMLKLPHSGFNVKLKVITASMRNDLQYNIINSILQLDRRFSGDIYTAVYVEIADIIMRFFLDIIEYTTVDYRKKDDLYKLILLKDFNIICLAINKLIYPEGYDDFAYVCGETVTEESGDTRVCANTYEIGTIDMDDLLYFTYDFTEDEVTQLAKTTKNALTVSAVEKYQKEFSLNAPAEVTIADLTFTINGGNMKNYIEKSREWMEISILSNDAFDKNEVEVIAELIEVTALGKYYYAITKIENESYTSSEIKVEHINILSSNPDIAGALIATIKANLSASAYVIAVPKYTCPSCVSNRPVKLDKNGVVIPHTEEIITNVNMIDLFTYLV